MDLEGARLQARLRHFADNEVSTASENLIPTFAPDRDLFSFQERFRRIGDRIMSLPHSEVPLSVGEQNAGIIRVVEVEFPDNGGPAVCVQVSAHETYYPGSQGVGVLEKLEAVWKTPGLQHSSPKMVDEHVTIAELKESEQKHFALIAIAKIEESLSEVEKRQVDTASLDITDPGSQ